MFCTRCGKQIPDDARFCKYCGLSVAPLTVKTCPSCGAEIDNDTVYCSTCGTRVSAFTPSAASASERAETKELAGDFAAQVSQIAAQKSAPPVQSAPPAAIPTPPQAVPVQPAPAPAPAPAHSGPLGSAQVSWYPNGAKTAKASGKLVVYSDRVELNKQFGSSTLSAFSPLASMVSAKKEGPTSFSMQSIASVCESTYGGIFPALVLTLKSGEKHTFAGTANRGAIGNCVQAIQRYIY